MPQASQRGRYLEVAESIRARIERGDLTRLPSVEMLRQEHGGVSRSLINRALQRLREDGVVTSVQGDGWHVLRPDFDPRPLVEQMIDVFFENALKVGDAFPSETSMCERFGKSRTAVRNALAQLEGAGLLARTPGGPRTVSALPNGGERKP